ncbi:MAG: hypothetical protein L0287_12960 [Anaerolineae bacterium]|nr:hypothetical protein [Anaerolineae bacterium]MCI0610947.1 hypothetical protein [Anaerolineae bacterium]
MPLPDALAKPIFHLIYTASVKYPLIRRKVMRLNEARKQVFDDLLEEALAGNPHDPMNYELPFPKFEFLNYICDWRGFVLHGSPLHDLEVLQPIRKSGDDNEFGNRQQIFASPDAIWAMWFAILDKDKFNLTNNGCVRVGRGDRRIKYYHFQLPKINREIHPFTEGMIYIARAEDFPDKRPYPILDWFNGEIEEWGSTQPVSPLARIRVLPQDFPYLDKVQFSL